VENFVISGKFVGAGEVVQEEAPAVAGHAPFGATGDLVSCPTLTRNQGVVTSSEEALRWRRVSRRWSRPKTMTRPRRPGQSCRLMKSRVSRW